MSERKYAHVVRAIGETPWAIRERELAIIRDIVAFRVNGGQMSDEEIQARLGASQSRRDMAMAGSIAILPVYGVIVPRADLFTQMSGGTSIQRLSASFREALADEQVSAIVFDIDSPGGHINMVPEFAAEVRAARAQKPIIAVANTLAASAAYWLGVSADEFVASPSAEVGSIGVITVHDDLSAMNEKLGIKTTVIRAGKFKGEANPWEPLSEEAQAALQERVDDAYRMFIGDVAKGRGVSVEAVRSGFGEGRVISPKKALQEGMIDRIDTFQATVSRLSRGRATNAPVSDPPEPPAVVETASDFTAAESGRSFADERMAVIVAAADLVNRTRSIIEAPRGRLSAATREEIAGDVAALECLATSLRDLLEATDSDREQRELQALALRAEADTYL